jgi:hypothetical protein
VPDPITGLLQPSGDVGPSPTSELMRPRALTRSAHRTTLLRLGALPAAAAVVLGLAIVPVAGAGADTTTSPTTGASTSTTAPASSPSTSAPTTTTTTTTPSTSAPTTTAPTPTTSAPAPSVSPSANAALTVPSYWTVASDGGVFAFGGAPFFGSEGGKHLNAPIVGISSTNDHGGYWLVASDGGIFCFGDANFYGSKGGMPLNQPIVGMTPTPDGGGYWLVASDGGVFSFGDANFYGSKGGMPLNQPIVAMAATTDGHGYWMAAADGGIFTFGDATFYGSMGGSHLNAPITGMTVTPGTGYMLVASDGGVFGFGAVNYFGSEGGAHLNKPVVGMASTPPGESGYWLVASDGGIFAFGNGGFYGSMGGQHLNSPMVGITQAMGDGTFTKPTPTTILASGSYGYDVSVFNCGNLPGAGAVNVVQVTGRSSGATNACLAQEASWAGAGLNLYIFLTFGASSAANMPGYCNGNVYYCYGYQAGLFALHQAQATGVPVNVNWWLDVESTTGTGLPAWSSNTLQNDWVIQGAHDGLAASGAANVGVYASPGGGWPQIAGNWPINYPYWMATWTSSGPNSCATVAGWQRSTPGLPSGGVPMVQWNNDAATVNGQDTDGDYVC